MSLDKIVQNYIAPAFLLDKNNKILCTNGRAKAILGEVKSLESIAHQFSFDICILNEENYLVYNPISAALLSKENFYAQCVLQINQNKFINVSLSKIKIDNCSLLLINNENGSAALQLEIETLQEQLLKYSLMARTSEEQALRLALVNKISSLIKDSLDLKEIINVAIDETSKVLNINKSLFVLSKNGDYEVIYNSFSKNIDKQKLLSSIETFDLQKISIVNTIDYLGQKHAQVQRLVIPVSYQNDIQGLVIFFNNNIYREWHDEELNFLDAIASQLATAIKQSKLFVQINDKNILLESTLKELTETQAHLIQSEKMASLGQLVAGVAHEINTPLGSVNSNIGILNKSLGSIATLLTGNNDAIKKITMLQNVCLVCNEAVMRINKIVRALKTFARLDEAELKEVDIHDGLNSTLMLVSHEIKGRIEIDKEYSEVPKLLCFPDLLNQVFMNLIVNAYQSIEGNGKIKIKTKFDGKHVIILIEDTGGGIPPQNIEKIFDPGFTTKGVGVGTGLGLAITYQIIQKHGGNIEVESVLGKGTIFKLVLPIGRNM